MTTKDRRAATQVLREVLRGAGYNVRTTSDGMWSFSSSRPFRCPSCKLELGLCLSEDGEIAAMHRVPECVHFLTADTFELALGSANYTRFRGAFTAFVGGPGGKA